MGHFALTGLLLEVLLQTPQSRVVTVSSGAHHFGQINFDDLHWEKRGYQPNPAYGQSKLANLLFTYELQRKLVAAGQDTIAVAAHPGWTETNLQRHSGVASFFNPYFPVLWRCAVTRFRFNRATPPTTWPMPGDCGKSRRN